MQKGKENGKSADEAIERKRSNASARKAQMRVAQRIKTRARRQSSEARLSATRKRKQTQRRASYQALGK